MARRGRFRAYAEGTSISASMRVDAVRNAETYAVPMVVIQVESPGMDTTVMMRTPDSSSATVIVSDRRSLHPRAAASGADAVASASDRSIVIVAPTSAATAEPVSDPAAWALLSTGTAASDPVVTVPAPGPDRALIAAARAGDLDAFNEIVDRYQRAVYNVALRIMREPSAAEDAAQDAMIKAWTAIGSFNGEILLPWLLRIVTNRCYDVIRARNRRPADSLDQEALNESSSWSTQIAQTEAPADFVDRAELSGRLRAALDALTPDQRAVVVLSDVHGHSYEEIAATLGVAVGTVKSRLCRGRSRLRELLRDEVRPREHGAAR